MNLELDHLKTPLKLAVWNYFGEIQYLRCAKRASINYQEYEVGMFVLHEYVETVPQFSKILRILFHDSKAFLLCERFDSVFEEFFCAFHLRSTSEIHILTVPQLSDFSPLYGYLKNGRIYVIPKKL